MLRNKRKNSGGIFNFRVTGAELETLKRNAKASQFESISEFIRSRCLDEERNESQTLEALGALSKFEHQIAMLTESLQKLSASAGSNAQTESLSEKLSWIESRFSKLENVQRALIVNTSQVRGFAFGMMTGQTSDVSRTIKEEMNTFLKSQREFFFSLYPEQKPNT